MEFPVGQYLGWPNTPEALGLGRFGVEFRGFRVREVRGSGCAYGLQGFSGVSGCFGVFGLGLCSGGGGSLLWLFRV